MKYLKRFNESKEEMTDKDRRAVVKKVKAEIKDNKDYKDLLSGQKEKFQDKLITKYCKEIGFKLTDFYATDGKKISKLLENREEREGTFDYFMTKSKEELIEYQKNFQHSFENPAEHDPKFVAWKKACEVKKCFPKDEPTQGFKGIQKEPGFPSKMIY
mgnify:FL=1|jgi:hypothetical protein